MKAQRSRRASFWTVYAIITACLVILIAAGLALFYDFIDAFDESQPQNPAEAAAAFANSLDADSARELLLRATEDVEWQSEASAEKYISECIAALEGENTFCRRSGGDDARPVYSLMAGGREVLLLELESTPTGRYSFTSWRVCDTSIGPDAFHCYSITVPRGSTVSVNGKLLDESAAAACDSLYRPTAFDGAAPECVMYQSELYDIAPSVTAVYEGVELELETRERSISAVYPASLLYTATVRVPHGSTVTVRGKVLSEHVKSTAEAAFGGMIADTVNAPQYDVYEICGLYAPLEDIAVTLDGRQLDFTRSDSERSVTVEHLLGGKSVDALSAYGEEFARAYFHYTSSGYRGIDENLAAVLTYVLPSSELYTRLRDSKIGYDYVTPVTSQVYNRLEIVATYELDDGSFVLDIAFDIDHTIYSEKRSYSGELFLHIVSTSGGYAVQNMTIENK